MLAFDFETHIIKPTAPFPRAVCLSVAEITDGAITDADVIDRDAGLALLERALVDGETFVGCETAFDVLVSIHSHPNPERMAALWIQAYADDRVTDVKLRQGLWDLSCGTLAASYALASVAAALGTEHQPDKSNPWRLRFGELDGVPVTEYPAEAYGYSLEDAIVTAECWLAQERLVQSLHPVEAFRGLNPLLDQYRQARGALALKDLSGAGLHTHPETVRHFRALTERRKADLEEQLIGEGLISVKYVKDRGALKSRSGLSALSRAAVLRHHDPAIRAVADWPRSAPYLWRRGLAKRTLTRATKRAQARIASAYHQLGGDVPLAPSGESPALHADACDGSGDPVMRAYSEYARTVKLLSTDFPLLEKAVTEPFCAHYRPLQSTGRTSTGSDDGESVGNVQNMPRRPGVRECYWPGQEGWVFFDADYPAIELRTFAQICYWAVGWSRLGDDLNAGVDPHLRLAAVLDGCSYEQALERKKALKDERTAGKGVNFGRKGGMGARRFVQYVWNNYRVRTDPIGQKWVAEVGAHALAKRYRWLLAPALPRSVPFAPAVFDADGLALLGAQRLIEIHDQLTPEFPAYSQWVQTFARDPGARETSYDLVHPWSGRLRAGLGYSDAHNYPFQGLAADVAKLALWRVFCARWGQSGLGRDDPLYQKPVVLFTHDSITGVCPRSDGPACAARLAALMSTAATEVLPDLTTTVVPTLSTRLSKKADDPVLDAEGNLIPWDPWEQCHQAIAFWRESGATDELAAVLREQHWPEYVIEDCCGTARRDRGLGGA